MYLWHTPSNALSLNYLEGLNANDNLPEGSGIRPRAALDIDLAEVAENTPDLHYAKKHPGAGWAGFRHPLYGGYLDNLRDGDGDSNTSEGRYKTGPDTNDDVATFDR